MVKTYLFEVLVGYRRLWALIDPLLLIYFFFYVIEHVWAAWEQSFCCDAKLS